MAEYMTRGLKVRGSQFFMTRPPDPTSRIYDACGVRAFASVVTAALNEQIGALAVYNTMREHGLCDPNGTTTTSKIGATGALTAYNLTQTAFIDYQAEGPAAILLEAKARAMAGDPFVMMFHNGIALKDYLSGEGENASTLANHFVAGLGYNDGNGASAYAGGRDLPAGFWIADGCNLAGGNDRANNFNAANVLQYYTETDLLAALPCALYAVRGYGEAMAWVRNADGSATDSEQHHAGAGVAAEIFSNGDEGSDGLTGETYYAATDSFTPLANGKVYHYSKTTGKVDTDAASVALDLYTRLAAANAQIAALQSGAGQAGPAEDAIKYLAVALGLKA